jgi:hypothetical protein
MRSLILTVVVLAVVGVILIGVYRVSDATAVPAPPMTAVRWEYRALTEPDLLALTAASTAEAGMNKLGDEGWELVAIKSTSSMKAAPTLFCFKRFKTGK